MMHERDRPVEQRLSVFDRPSRADDAVPAHFFEFPTHLAERADKATVRLALRDGDRHIYVWRGVDADEVYLRYRDGSGGMITGGRRSTWTAKGASISGCSNDDRAVVLGLVPDSVTAVRVGHVEALLQNNAYLADAALGAPVVLTTLSGERILPVDL